MTLLIGIIIFCTWLLAFVVLISAGRFLKNTNARSAHKWGVISSLLSGTLFLVSNSPLEETLLKNEALWYLSAIFWLAPFISVLGARRPVNKFWSFFVVSPMLLVLGYPLLITWVGGGFHEEFSIQPPVLIGFLVVLTMGVGNYLGTLFTLPAFLAGCSVMLIVIPLTSTVPEFFPASQYAFPAAVMLHAISILWVYWKITMKNRRWVGFPHQLAWLDFRDLFGIVWAKRVAEQVNLALNSHHLPVQLELHGLVWHENEMSLEQDSQAMAIIDQQLRWALSRFVETTWIEHYLQE